MTALQGLGLRPEEARTYLALLRTGPMGASTVAGVAGMSRSKSYRVLESLTERGYVDASLGTPALHQAKPPETLFDLQLEDLEVRRSGLAELRDDILHHLEGLAVENDEVEGRHRWRNLQGRPRAYQAARDLVQGAEDEVVMMSSHQAFTNAVPLVEATWTSAVERAREHDVAVRVLLDEGVPTGKRILAWAKEPNVEVRVVPFEMELKLVVVDRAETVQWLDIDPSERAAAPGDVAVRSDAPGLVGPPLRLLRELWEGATLL